MKKLLLMATMFASTVCNAQVVLWDGEDESITSRNEYGGFWDRCTPSVVENPEKDGINTSNKCLKFTMIGDGFGQKQVACPFKDWITPALNLNGNRRLSFMIKKSVNENVLVELSDPTNGADNYWQKVAAWYGGSGKWQKVVLDFSTNDGLNDFPGVMAITGQTASVTTPQDVYIDNIVVEPIPMVGLTPLKDVTDGTLEGAITVTGSYMKGTCSNANDGWFDVNYDDFATLKNKVAAGITSIDMEGAIVKEAYNSVGAINPNALIYATAADGDNVVIDGTCATLNLNDGYAFSCPEDFTATTVNLTRSRIAGYNSFVLPFWVSATDLGASKVYTHKEGTTFKLDTDAYNPDGVAGANVPFLADYAAASSDVIVFSNKGVCATPANYEEVDFRGVFARQSANGLWGINADGNLQKGGSSAFINPFHAYLIDDAVNDVESISIFDGKEVTAINTVQATEEVKGNGECYDLQGRRVAYPQKGLYIVNGRKVAVW
jgi:hypothetical protein